MLLEKLCCCFSVGNLCEKTETSQARTIRESCDTFDDYLDALSKPSCTGAGTFTWTPDKDTPDQVYYQVGTCPYSL